MAVEGAGGDLVAVAEAREMVILVYCSWSTKEPSCARDTPQAARMFIP